MRELNSFFFADILLEFTFHLKICRVMFSVALFGNLITFYVLTFYFLLYSFRQFHFSPNLWTQKFVEVFTELVFSLNTLLNCRYQLSRKNRGCICREKVPTLVVLSKDWSTLVLSKKIDTVGACVSVDDFLYFVDGSGDDFHDKILLILGGTAITARPEI